MVSTTSTSTDKVIASQPQESQDGKPARENLSQRVDEAASGDAAVFSSDRCRALWSHGLRLMGGTSITAASSVFFGPTLVMPLVRMAQDIQGAAPLLGSVPPVDRVAGGLLSNVGALGALAVAAPLIGLALALPPSGGEGPDRFHWLLAHIAMGLSASPAWLVPVAQLTGALPALAIAGACMVGVSVLLSERLSAKQASVQMVLLGVGLVLAGAPLPALLATGAAGAQAVNYGVLVLTGGAAALAGYRLYRSCQEGADDSALQWGPLKVTSERAEASLGAPGSSAHAESRASEPGIHAAVPIPPTDSPNSSTSSTVSDDGAPTLEGYSVEPPLADGNSLISAFPLPEDDSAFELSEGALEWGHGGKILNLPGALFPNIFCHDKSMLEHVKSIKDELDAGKHVGVRTMMLSGPPSTDQSTMAQAIGDALGAKTYMVHYHDIYDSDNPAEIVAEIMKQFATSTGRAVIYLDYVDHVFPKHKVKREYGYKVKMRKLVADALHGCMYGAFKDKYQMVLVVVCANRREELDADVEKRFADFVFDLRPPTREESAQMLRDMYARQFTKLAGEFVNRLMIYGAKDSGHYLSEASVDRVLDAFENMTAGEQKVVITWSGYERLCAMVVRNKKFCQALLCGQFDGEDQFDRAFEEELSRFMVHMRKSVEHWR